MSNIYIFTVEVLNDTPKYSLMHSIIVDLNNYAINFLQYSLLIHVKMFIFKLS